MGVLDQTVDTLPSPEAKNWPLPLLTPAGGGHDLDLRRMAADGVTLLGHLKLISGTRFIIAPDLKESLANGDRWFTDHKRLVDEYVIKTSMAVSEESQSLRDMAEPKEVSNPISELDLKTSGITSIIWATGFRYDLDWVKLPIFNDTGDPVHRRGVTSFPGIYFLGLRWLYKRKSFFLIMSGPAEDAAYLAEHIKAREKQD